MFTLVDFNQEASSRSTAKQEVVREHLKQITIELILNKVYSAKALMVGKRAQGLLKESMSCYNQAAAGTTDTLLQYNKQAEDAYKQAISSILHINRAMAAKFSQEFEAVA